MFNSGLKDAAVERLKKSEERYNQTSKETHEKAAALHQFRTETADKVISSAEQYFSSLANAPKEFEKAVAEYRVAFERFQSIAAEVIANAEKSRSISHTAAGASVMAAVGVAGLGAPIAVGIATTFGTASTGVAIAGLSGAAAEGAALAWLGGGALAAGGGGMAAGEALLMLAGPVGGESASSDSAAQPFTSPKRMLSTRNWPHRERWRWRVNQLR